MNFDSPRKRMRSYIQRIATGPELSKPLTREQARDGFQIILNHQVDPVQTAIFLIALRMKRETDDENLGVLDALKERCRHANIKADELLSISDPFNGFVRGLPATPFLPAVLAACGLPAYLHGVHQMGPKYGITGHQVLEAAGYSVDLSPGNAARQLEDPKAGWAYLDQQQYLPELHELCGLRDKMVKRSLISTLEVAIKPVSGKSRTHLYTGYVHKAYPPVYEAIARHAGFQSMILVKGVEGGCIPSLSQVSRYFGYVDDSPLVMHKLSPFEVGIEREKRMVPVDEEHAEAFENSSFHNIKALAPVVSATLELGREALAGARGPMYDSLVYGAAIALMHTGKAGSWQEAGEISRHALMSGEARARFDAGCACNKG
ncbi:MAG: anthranilate phosphoribosyltransferase [Gammaproteobacteria bacterium]|nr:anthranilate phosphoribosyltransferase [Gammaproteobacteria bacterium]MCY4227593.1 anthranilate phosphoribosyltransferase [Gammaproteobacteria bacterium]MCY4313076.1 anthranilate phosphoribosyltransferase [Gammaproteobacteria bacterium]